ncbi:MAG: YbaB/EbfC family nucleoid-associated protein [Spirochaetaceae bacterium]|jgi:DNA-binding YbaB/EbfC family protein|nr:YbaB/EbfC family nucleoid-associated protein [Spirochaetaceae bacterium]
MNINPFDILKNAQKLQEQMGGFQEKLGNIVVTGSAGGGMVEVTLNGKMEVISLRLEPEAVNPQDIPMLQDLIAAAFSNGLEKVKEAVNREVGAMAGLPDGILPGFPGFTGAS